MSSNPSPTLQTVGGGDGDAVGAGVGVGVAVGGGVGVGVHDGHGVGVAAEQSLTTTPSIRQPAAETLLSEPMRQRNLIV